MIWKPIEDAPKDRRVLLFYPQPEYAQYDHISVGRWVTETYHGKDLAYWFSDVAPQFRAWVKRQLQPTHYALITRPAVPGQPIKQNMTVKYKKSDRTLGIALQVQGSLVKVWKAGRCTGWIKMSELEPVDQS